MPVVFVQVGQAGNQIGGELWKIIKKEFSRHHNLYFNRGKARCIAVDSEPKVVRHLLEEHGDIMRESNVMFEQAGRGNNWAYGFFDIAGRTHKTDSISSPSASHIGDTEPIWRDGDTSLLGRVMGAFHKEVEACDMYHGCVVIHSLAGGTGSGLGSRIVSAIRDEYPHGYVLSIVVSPFEGGEVTLFHYNALLALSTLQTDSDGIILMHNEGSLQATGKLLAKVTKNSRAGHSLSFPQLNHNVAHSLAGLMCPITPSGRSDLRVTPHVYASPLTASMLQKEKKEWSYGEYPFDIADLGMYPSTSLMICSL
eukprot:TRINITY_DN6438_c0_g1_i3.p1 TRINITY_DN6438_c0_g1~~TRINITY_DN6438_c0_g1_i3.p1  ORF type:complete len:310 (+),score=48.60 TRINITY_DN6438_c0_g1_i3:32-961(+)